MPFCNNAQYNKHCHCTHTPDHLTLAPCINVLHLVYSYVNSRTLSNGMPTMVVDVVRMDRLFLDIPKMAIDLCQHYKVTYSRSSYNVHWRWWIIVWLGRTVVHLHELMYLYLKCINLQCDYKLATNVHMNVRVPRFLDQLRCRRTAFLVHTHVLSAFQFVSVREIMKTCKICSIFTIDSYVVQSSPSIFEQYIGRWAIVIIHGTFLRLALAFYTNVDKSDSNTQTHLQIFNKPSILICDLCETIICKKVELRTKADKVC
jgi:hypothetical protein